uniref:glutathione transferase (Fragments) n=1 Tax=Rattus norvegicus TaxID=10116 RepID=Q7M0F1_RAT
PMILGYWNVRYAMGDAPDYDRSQWLNLGLDFPNLPYLIDGSRKHHLCGETEEERIRMQLIMLCYNPDFEKQKRPWFAGDKVTYVDFLAYDILDQYHIFEPKCLDAFPNLKDFLAR